MKDDDKISLIIEKINYAWLNKEFHLLEDLLHESVIFLSPDFKESLDGKKACIRSYRDFMDKARKIKFIPEKIAVFFLNETAVATCPFKIGFEIQDQMNFESGTEILIFEKTRNRWLLRWRVICNLKTITGEAFNL